MPRETRMTVAQTSTASFLDFSHEVALAASARLDRDSAAALDVGSIISVLVAGFGGGSRPERR